MTDVAFGNLAHDSARAFRPILDAMANPGKIYSFNPPVQAPVELGPEAAAVALALCDFQSPIWLESSLRITEIQQYIRFHTGAPITNSKPDAMFAFIDAARAVPDLADFPMGTQDYPDRSVTLVIKAERLTNNSDVTLKGPGIQSTRGFGAAPVSSTFWNSMIASRTGFPLGMDIIFVGNHQVAALPRSTQISIDGAA